MSVFDQVKLMTRTIATLGPAGTFADIATRKYQAENAVPSDIRYYSSIRSALSAIGRECDVAVLPIENFSEGFIPIVLDALAKRDAELYICYEIRIPIRFSFVSNSKKIGNVGKVFAQFFASGQCSEFLAALGAIESVATQSNIQSLESLRVETSAAGAIVPAHAVTHGDFPLVIANVDDSPDNETRFIAVSGTHEKYEAESFDEFKTSLIVYGDNDYPGLLSDILSSLSSRRINVMSLVSRPSRVKFGQYDFFIDAIGNEAFPKLTEAIDEIGLKCAVRSLGSYKPALRQSATLNNYTPR